MSIPAAAARRADTSHADAPVIIVGYDGSEESRMALAVAAERAGPEGTIVPVPKGAFTTINESERPTAHAEPLRAGDLSRRRETAREERVRRFDDALAARAAWIAIAVFVLVAIVTVL